MIAERVSMQLCSAFDIASRAMRLNAKLLDERSAREMAEAFKLLREALDDARALGDLGGLKCPPVMWALAQNAARLFLECDPEIRDGRIGRLAELAISTLLAWETGKLQAEMLPTPRILTPQQRAAGERDE